MLSYSELINIDSYDERLKYLTLNDLEPGQQGRRFNMRNRKQWENVRETVIGRDSGYDLGLPGVNIAGPVIVHHMNPVTAKMIQENDPLLYDPENLICVSITTHNRIHYGNVEDIPDKYIERTKGDNCLWQPLKKMSVR